MYITFIPVTFNPDLKPEVVAQDMFWKRYSFLKEISAFITDKYTEVTRIHLVIHYNFDTDSKPTVTVLK